jgi:hypothetical protein
MVREIVMTFLRLYHSVQLGTAEREADYSHQLFNSVEKCVEVYLHVPYVS